MTDMRYDDSFTIYLHSLDPSDVKFEVLDDGRRILNIKHSVGLYVRPGDDDLPDTIDGLRKLSAAAREMAQELSGLVIPASAS
jgi:hypothetical protein